MEAKIRVYAKAQNRTALGIANAYLRINPNATLQDLNNAFPISLNSSNRSEAIFVDVNDKGKFVTEKEGNSTFELFFFEKEEELLTLNNGQKVAMLELWVKDDYLKIVEHAKQYGIEVADFKPAKPFEKGGFLLEELHPIIAPKVSEVQTPKKNNNMLFGLIGLGIIAIIIIIVATQCNSNEGEKQLIGAVVADSTKNESNEQVLNAENDEIDEPVVSESSEFSNELVETTIKRIRAVFYETQANANSYEVVNKENGNIKLKSYLENGKVRLIIAEISGQPAENYYYDNNQFIFMYNNGKEVNRYYFSGNKMIRWLDPAKNMMDKNTSAYSENQNRVFGNGVNYLKLFL